MAAVEDAPDSTKGEVVRGRVIRNVPDPFRHPWQWGLRAPADLGGNDDAEVLQEVPQGEPQPLIPEAPLSPANAESAEITATFVQAQIDMCLSRYYDAVDLLGSYQHVLTNQHRPKGGANALPKAIHILRAREDELPLPYRWQPED